MKVIGLDHIQLTMPPRGEDQARAFYRDVLGMIEVDKPKTLAVRGGVWFTASTAALHLGIEDPFHPSAKAHAAFLVADLDALRDELIAAGSKFEDDRAVEGVRRGYTNDPFGNRIELIQDGDGSTQKEWR